MGQAVNVLRVTHSEQLANLRSLVAEALATSPLVTDAAAAIIELAGKLNDPDLGLFVCDGGMLLIECRRGFLSPGCTVVHVYCPKGGRKELLAAGTTLAKERGCTRWFGVDINKRGEAYERLIKPDREIGMMYEGNIDER